ncbi:MAG: YbaB/EbfC family nucleoid-associated protein [Caulobacteraceae bacterium]
MGLTDLKDLGSLMKQAQAMQGKLQEAQAELGQIEVEGVSGGGMVRLRLRGSGELIHLGVDESLLRPGEGGILTDLVIAAHADAKRKLDERQSEIMREVAGPLAGAPGLFPGMPGS